jgi:uncharacterized protein YcnI
MRIFGTAALAATILAGASGLALAHVTLEGREATAGSTYKAVLRVPHGCEGSATVSLRVQIPEGVIGVKPMPKQGWTLTTVVGDYAKPYKLYDETLTKGVKEIAWTGGKLQDDWYDEFVFRAVLPNDQPGTMVYFPVVQQCEKGINRWIEIPSPGKNSDDYKEPAPGVKLTGKSS